MGIVEYERQGNIAIITMNRPERLNALGYDMMLGLAQTWACFQEDEEAWVGIITGTGRSFCAGLDLKERLDSGKAGLALPRIPIRDPFFDYEIDKPTIAAVNGFALGGGAELAMCCDFRIAGEGAVFGQPEVLLGLIPGGGATQRLARLVGVTKAKELIWGGAQVKAPEALAIGWVDEVVPDDQVLDRAVERATGYANGPRIALRASKRAIDEGIQGTLADGVDLELDLFMEVFESGDAASGVASFFEHGPGKATFTDR